MVGLDLGERRIGVAVSDPSGSIASPYEVVERTADDGRTYAAIARIVEEVGAERVVVGLPLSLTGAEGPAAAKVRAEVAELGGAVGVPVETVDERFTTVTAHQALAGRGVKEKKRRGQVDKVAAAVLLQAWLDRRANEGNR